MGRPAGNRFSGICGRSDFVAHRGVSVAQEDFCGPVHALPEAPGKAATRVARGIQAPESAGARLASRLLHPGGIPDADSTTGGLLRADAAVARMAIRLAAG